MDICRYVSEERERNMETIQIMCYILSAVALIMFCLLIYNTYLKKNEKRNKINDNILSVLSILIAFVSFFAGNYTGEEIDALNENNISINAADESKINMGDINIDSPQQYYNETTIFEDETDSAETLLNYARIYYTANEYEKMVRIYADSRLEDNVIALNNLGYMYANGIYFEKNVEEANFYYDRAIELGCQQAYSNKMAMYLEEHLDGIPEVVLLGLELDNDCVINFISEMFETDADKTQRDVRKSILRYFCHAFDKETQQAYIDNYCYQEWGEPEYIETTKNIKASFMVKYVYVTKRQNGYGYTTVIYEKYTRKVKNIEMFDEKMIFE